MLFHAARLNARTDASGNTVLLEDQDCEKWDRSLVSVAESWLARSRTETVSHFHLEAAISQQHCRAGSVAATDWALIVRLYDRLIAMHDSPLYVLNRAIARGQAGDVPTALDELASLRRRREMSNYYLLECAQAWLHEMAGNDEAAVSCYRSALEHDLPAHQRMLLAKRLDALSR
jgi:RNA polymerase sigma-70 factor (ECF subfamily)